MEKISLSMIESGSKYLYKNKEKNAAYAFADVAATSADSVQVGTVAYDAKDSVATLTLTSSDSVEVVSDLTATADTLTAVTITGGAAGSTYSLAKLKGTVTGSSGADSFNLDGDDTITLGGGADSVTLAADAANVTITDLATNGAKATFVVGDNAVNMTGFGAASLSTTGDVNLAGASLTVVQPTETYYSASFNGTNIAWTRTNATTIDLSKQEGPYSIFSINGGKNDITGSKGADAIHVAANDTVSGGKGNDTIYATGKDSVTYNFTANEGKDSVQGFQGGFDAAAGTVYIASATDASLVNTKLDATGHTVTLYGTGTDNYSITLNEGTSSDVTANKANVKLAVGSDSVKNYEFLANTYDPKKSFAEGVKAQLLTDSVQVVYGTDAVSGEWVKLDDSTKRTAINLSTYQKDKADGGTTYANISGIDAKDSTTDDVLIGSGKFNTTIRGGKGADSIWGGVGSTNDSIVLDGDTVKGSTVFFGTSNGNDTVTNFTDNDSIVVYDYAKPTSVTKTPSADEEKGNNITATFADGSTLVLKNVSDMTNGTIKAKAYGDTAYKFQLATEEFSATKGTDIYYATQEGSKLNITDDYDSSTLWLYDYNNVPKGKDYSKAMVNGKNTYVKINAAGRSDDLALTGTKNNDTIVAGTGKTTMWGGSGTDVLYGNETGDGIATFYFLKGYKADTTVYSYNTLDKIAIAGGTTLSDVKSWKVSGGVLSAELTDGSKLTVNNFGTTGTSTVTLGGTDYTYDSTTSKFTAKA
jgi:hypothetical protein